LTLAALANQNSRHYDGSGGDVNNFSLRKWRFRCFPAHWNCELASGVAYYVQKLALWNYPGNGTGPVTAMNAAAARRSNESERPQCATPELA
jgi:hypothetical protein